MGQPTHTNFGPPQYVFGLGVGVEENMDLPWYLRPWVTFPVMVGLSTVSFFFLLGTGAVVTKETLPVGQTVYESWTERVADIPNARPSLPKLGMPTLPTLPSFEMPSTLMPGIGGPEENTKAGRLLAPPSDPLAVLRAAQDAQPTAPAESGAKITGA